MHPLRLARRHQIWIEKYVLTAAHCYAESLYATAALTFHALSDGVPGALMECGVASGSHPAVMSYCTRYTGVIRAVYLADSFCGLPQPHATDIRPNGGPDIRDSLNGMSVVPDGEIQPSGQVSVPVDDVRRRMTESGANPAYTKYVVGWFQDTLPTLDIGPLAVLRLDADLYESTKMCMDNLYPNVSSGGYVILHDWCYPGVCRAVEEHLGYTPEVNVVDEPADYPLTVWWRKK